MRARSLTYPRPKPISPCRLRVRVCVRRSRGPPSPITYTVGIPVPWDLWMVTHAPHPPGIHHGGALFPPAAAICPHGFHKSMQAVRVALLIGIGPVTEHAQICLPQLSARLCAVMCIKSAALEKTPQVFGQRHAARIKPLGLQRVSTARQRASRGASASWAAACSALRKLASR